MLNGVINKENSSLIDSGKVFEGLLMLAVGKGITVKFVPFRILRGALSGNRLGIRQDLRIDQINHTLAHEIAHAYLRFDKGDTINSEKHPEYEEQAERGARMLLDILTIQRCDAAVTG